MSNLKPCYVTVALALALSLSVPWMPQGAFAAETAQPVSKVSALSLGELEHGISDRLKRVEEFRYIEQEAARLGVRAWLFGGTAAGYAHYVKWDLLREKGDPRFQPDRFDYDYTNIFRSTQDLDVVIDGNAEQAQALQDALARKYPHLQGSKTAWEVRLLTQDMGDKQAILDNPDFMNQHTDSNSTGMVEITKPNPGESVVRDVRDWKSKKPYFLKDIHDGALHYYFSPLHETTRFAKEGRNPPILSAIRFFTKAFQYELKIRPEDLAQIKKIIDAFDPSKDIKDSYVSKWIEKNGKKLFQNAVNLEYAWNTLEQLGLRSKLQTIKNNAAETDSLAWWMNKEPLRTQPVGRGSGKTARELGLDIVAHETNNFLAYESITRAHTGDPNVLISRDGVANETAIHGDGFYTKTGREGARGSGLTIRFHLDPDAREGEDFIRVPKDEYVIIRNKAALKVIPESLNIGPVEFFQMLDQENAGLGEGDRGVLEKLKRRIGAKLQAMSDNQLREILKIVKANADRSVDQLSPLLMEWLKLPISRQYPEVIGALMKKGPKMDKVVALAILSRPEWKNHPELLDQLVAKGTVDPEIVKEVLTKPHWQERPKWIERWVERLIERGTADMNIAMYILSQPQWDKHPEWVEKLVKRGNIDIQLAANVLKHPHWKDHPEWIDELLKRGNADSAIVSYVLSRPHTKDHPEWVEHLLKNGTVDEEIAISVLSQELWKDHPEWVDQLLEKGNVDGTIAHFVLPQPHWKDRLGKDRLKWFEKILDRGNADATFVHAILSRPEWSDHPEWVERLLQKGSPDVDARIVGSVLTKSHWKNHPEWVEHFLKKGTHDKDIIEYVLSKEHWSNHPEWVESLLKKGTFDEEIIKYVLAKPHWKDHPEWVEHILKKGTKRYFIKTYVLTEPHWKEHPEWIEMLIKESNFRDPGIDEALKLPHWKDHPELRRLAGEAEPTYKNLREAFDRGETVRVSAPNVGACVSRHLVQALK